MQVRLLLEQTRSPVPGGTGRYAAELARALALGCAPEDELVGVFATAGPVPDHLHRHETIGIPAKGLARLWERGVGPRLRGAGVIHAPTLLVPPTGRSHALVVTIHDVVPWTHPETLTARGVAFHRRMGARAAAEADVIVTPTQAVASRVVELLAPTGEVVVVPLGVTRLEGDVQHESGPPADPGYVLFVGTAEPRKGLDVLLAAMAQPALAQARLVVVGPHGWGGVDVPSMAAGLGVSDRVHVAGRVSDADLHRWYAGAAVVAVPSRSEGFGLPVVEAMAAGTPVVTSDDAALVEVGGGAAVVVPVGDSQALAEALGSVLADSGLATGLSARGLERSRLFEWHEVGSRMWQIYAGALSRRGARPA